MNAHILLKFYVADISESEDLSTMKRGNQTVFPCHQWLARKIQVKQYKKARRKAVELKKPLADHQDTTANHDVLLATTQHSIHPGMPVLPYFSFFGTYSDFDIYALFDVDPMHILSLGICRLLKECLLTKLGDVERTPVDIKTELGSSKTFKYVKRFVLQCLNKILKKVSRVTPGHVLEISLTHKDLLCRNNGMCCDEGPTEMLEARKMEPVNNTLSLGAIEDACCGNEIADASRTFTYIDR